MRIVEPEKLNQQEPTKHRKISKKLPLLLLILIVLIAILYIRSTNEYVSTAVRLPNKVNNTINEKITTDDVSHKSGELRTFSGNELRLLYDQLPQQNLVKIHTPPYITGNEVADTRIRQIAERRGYLLRSTPLNALAAKDGLELQEQVYDPWLQLQSKARNEGLKMTITSSHRSIDTQRRLFVSRLSAEGVNVDDVAAGLADEQIDKVLATTSPPGYSKHHTGYTFDLLCGGFAFTNFENSTCNTWLKANNYQAAKEYGFIPSYPIGADLQGPNPEAWEYVYVGTELLRY